ncbi:MAG TPA: Gfo/Idh/MocA family oxidoreductase [Planctomycetes bacterium]|nr:Gfo/Idh/MocA family oxidoreductase [Planctomycetota bacterium]
MKAHTTDKDKPAAGNEQASRRQFLQRSGGLVAGAALTSGLAARSYAGEDNTIRVALVGCGGRGTGAAANALSTEGPTKLVAMADVFESRLQSSLKRLSGQFGKQVDVPPDRQFVGFDAYRKAIDCLRAVDVVLLTTPPAFRPLHLEYAVEKGVNVFMEKSFAVDGPGIRRVLKAGEVASKKNLKIVGGLNQRYAFANQDAVRAVREGMIGEVVTCWAYREHGPVGFKPREPGLSELLHQIRNYSCFTWTNGSFMLDWLIHNIDVCCWVKDAWPASAQGQGGRQVRQQPDQLFDHYAVEYRFADGTRLFAQGRHMANCWGYFGVIVHGARGCAYLGEGTRRFGIYKGWLEEDADQLWKPPRTNNSYQTEHDVLFEAIRQDKAHNDTQRCAYAALSGILGRMAAESGKEVTWEQALNSDLVLAPGLDDFTMDSEAPVKPDAEGHYPIAMPGFTKAF